MKDRSTEEKPHVHGHRAHSPSSGPRDRPHIFLTELYGTRKGPGGSEFLETNFFWLLITDKERKKDVDSMCISLMDLVT